MPMSRHLIAVLACAAPLLGAASGVFAMSDRDDIEKWCTHSSAVASGRCFGYLLAVEDVLAHDSIEGIRACLPKEIGLAEQHRIVLEWIRANPQSTVKSPAGMVARAYAQRYPCER